MAEPTTWEEAAKVQNEAFTAFKEANDRAQAEIKKLGAASGETLERVEKAEKGLDEAQDALNGFQAEIAAVKTLRDELETKMQLFERAGKKAGEAAVTHDERYVKAYDKWLRGGSEELKRGPYILSDEEIEILDKGATPAEHKSISTDSGETGGYAMPAPQRQALVEKLIEFSPIEELANVETISIGDSLDIPAEGDQNFVAAWTSERGARTETQAGQLRKVSITAHEAYANPFITRKSLDDPAIDLAAWTNRRLVKRFAVLFGTAYAVGTGSGQPSGIATNTNRQTNAINSGHASQLTADGLLDLYYALPELYARQATWVMRRAALKDIRKLKASGTGEYLFVPATTATPPSILEQPYREALDMPAVSANTYPIAFGDINSAYTVVRRQDIFQLRNPYRNPPYIEFMTTMRRGGEVVLPEAFLLQKVAA